MNRGLTVVPVTVAQQAHLKETQHTIIIRILDTQAAMGVLLLIALVVFMLLKFQTAMIHRVGFISMA